MIRVYTRRPPGFYLITDVQSITFTSSRVNDLNSHYLLGGASFMKFTFFNYLCANHYGMHMVRRFKVITMTVCIGYMVAIAFGLAPQLVSLIAVATAGKTILSAIGIGFAICETIAFCQKLGGYKRAIARKFY